MAALLHSLGQNCSYNLIVVTFRKSFEIIFGKSSIFSASALGGMGFNILWSLYLKPNLIQQAWDEKLNGTSTGISPFIILGSLMICFQAIGFFILFSDGLTLG